MTVPKWDGRMDFCLRTQLFSCLYAEAGARCAHIGRQDRRRYQNPVPSSLRPLAANLYSDSPGQTVPRPTLEVLLLSGRRFTSALFVRNRSAPWKFHCCRSRFFARHWRSFQRQPEIVCDITLQTDGSFNSGGLPSLCGWLAAISAEQPNWDLEGESYMKHRISRSFLTSTVVVISIGLAVSVGVSAQEKQQGSGPGHKANMIVFDAPGAW